MSTVTKSHSKVAAALTGVGFGLTSGVLTTLGLIVGLNAGTNSRTAVAAGIATIAIADALSDALGIHVSQESAGVDGVTAWIAAGVTFAAKLVFALTFLVPVLLLSLGVAVIVSIAWGLLLLTAFSWYIARRQGESPLSAIVEHLSVAAAMLVSSQGVGLLINAIAD